ncbi:hypothetical protein L484_020468 [Morus notabilis]|uniref:Uncharacterized protein n=1 Tax=Morus notabilis TaxID=981085 RepID=W9SBK1_9ROSA|nr:hypothetical protein L484_020468 [Morus notabilis]
MMRNTVFIFTMIILKISNNKKFIYSVTLKLGKRRLENGLQEHRALGCLGSRRGLRGRQTGSKGKDLRGNGERNLTVVSFDDTAKAGCGGGSGGFGGNFGGGRILVLKA